MLTLPVAPLHAQGMGPLHAAGSDETICEPDQLLVAYCHGPTTPDLEGLHTWVAKM